MSSAARFDVIVVGGGPAGLSAALAATHGTSSIALIDEGIAPGGQIWRRDVRDPHASPAHRWIEALGRSPVEVISGATVFDARTERGRHRLRLQQGDRTFDVESATIILATGARELFLPFPGWTLPGVLGVGGAQAMAKSGLDVRGKRVVVAGSGPLLIAVAAALVKKGAEVTAVVEQAPLTRMLSFGARAATRPRVAGEAIRYMQHLNGGTLRFGSWVTRAHGRDRVEAVTLSDGRNEQRVDCDILCTGYGLVPNTELGRMLGVGLSDGAIRVDGHQRTSVEGIFAAGECAGIGGVDVASIEGRIAGQTAVGIPPAIPFLWRRDSARTWSGVLARTFALRTEVLGLAEPKTIVCRCEDVRFDAVDFASTAREAKLHSRLGMGACQGRVCGAAMRHLRGWDLDTVRTPLQPVPLSALIDNGAIERVSPSLRSG